MAENQGAVVAKFNDLDSANKALRNLRDAQEKRGLDIKEGAVVVGTVDGVMQVTGMDDIGLGDVASRTLDLVTFLGLGATKIAADAAIAGGLLLLSSARRAAALGGSVLVMPGKMFLGVLETDKSLDTFGATIDPGACAVIAVVDDPATAAQVMAELSESGGQVIEADAVVEA